MKKTVMQSAEKAECTFTCLSFLNMVFRPFLWVRYLAEIVLVYEGHLFNKCIFCISRNTDVANISLICCVVLC